MKKTNGKNATSVVANEMPTLKPRIFLRRQIPFSIDLAYNYGVRTAEAFERAKKLHFGMSAFMPT